MIPSHVAHALAPIGAISLDIVHPSGPAARPGLRIHDGAMHLGLAFSARFMADPESAKSARVVQTPREAVLHMLAAHAERLRARGARLAHHAVSHASATLGRTVGGAADDARRIASQMEALHTSVGAAWQEPMTPVLPPELVRVLAAWDATRTMTLSACGMATDPTAPRVVIGGGEVETHVVWEARTPEDIGMGHSAALAVDALLEARAMRLRTSPRNNHTVVRDVAGNPGAARHAAAILVMRERVRTIALLGHEGP